MIVFVYVCVCLHRRTNGVWARHSGSVQEQKGKKYLEKINKKKKITELNEVVSGEK